MAHPADLISVGLTRQQALMIGFTFEILVSGATGAVNIIESVVQASAQASPGNYVMLPLIDASIPKFHLINNINLSNNLRIRASGSQLISGGNVDASTHEILPSKTILFVKRRTLPSDPEWGYVEF